ncbi:Dephospho-CoA kinase [hydrothermal vent metagenome]|uniref:Dephospho-CoA kinase n=1 Tax=hydrothermal vent metagenome TaxID=652676 RepID=A0A1W1CUV2_9ZZZZ
MSSIKILKIALTGGIACGKTQVSNLFLELGMDIIDMDKLSREVVMPNSIALAELQDVFSSDIIQKDGFLDRTKLRQILFSDKTAKTTIENILHPKIIELMQQKIQKLSAKIVIVEVPLLLEKNLQFLFDKFIVVDCDEQYQLQRLQTRDLLSKKEAENILKQQISQQDRLSFAKQDNVFLIKNNTDLDNLKKQVQSIFKRLTI